MREVDLITTSVKKMGVSEDMRHIQMHRMQTIAPIHNEAVIPIDCSIDYEEYQIHKVNIDGVERYVAMDKSAESLVDDVIRTNQCMRRQLMHAGVQITELMVQVDKEKERASNAWEIYGANISYLRKASFLVRLKYLLTGRMY